MILQRQGQQRTGLRGSQGDSFNCSGMTSSDRIHMSRKILQNSTACGQGKTNYKLKQQGFFIFTDEHGHLARFHSFHARLCLYNRKLNCAKRNYLTLTLECLQPVLDSTLNVQIHQSLASSHITMRPWQLFGRASISLQSFLLPNGLSENVNRFMSQNWIYAYAQDWDSENIKNFEYSQ